MLIRKEKMKLRDFISEACRNIIKTSKESYDEYLKEDVEKSLSEMEFNDFISHVDDLRLLLFMANIFDSNIQAKYNYTSEDIGSEFVTGLFHAYIKNSYIEDDAENETKRVCDLIENYFEYISNFSEMELQKNGFVYHICLYFSKEIMGLSADNPKKMGIIASLINSNKKIISEYFITIYKKVKIIS